MRYVLLLSFCIFVSPAYTETKDPPALPVRPPKTSIPQYLQDVSVTLQAGPYQGSGVYCVTKDNSVWVLTCAHVVESLRRTREVLDGKGGKKIVVEFDDVYVKQYVSENGRLVGNYKYDAEVIRYSDAQHGEDLAILRLRTKKFKPATTKFYSDDEIPPVGESLIHVGSLLGEFGSNSVTTGIMSQHGRLLNKKVYDQTTCSTYGGSSGGLVALKEDGRYVGMIVRGAVGGFSLMVPIRRIKEWTDKVGMTFILDQTKDVPTEEKLRSFPVESEAADAGLSLESRKMPPANRFPFLIHISP